MRTATKRMLLAPANFVNSNFLHVNRMSMGCARGALNAATRRFQPRNTASWEFSAFSQNGEDGIIEELLSRLKVQTRYFVEIGAADGLENNTAYLAFVKKYSGVMVEGDPLKSRHAKRVLWAMNHGVHYLHAFVEPAKIGIILDRCRTRTPDFFSLDIDGMDFHVAQALFAADFRPRVVCVEYNSAYGPKAALTVPYQNSFGYGDRRSGLYYGVSLGGWQLFFARLGYEFVTVESNGVNAFFVDPVHVDLDVAGLVRIDFAENCAHQYVHPGGWTEQWPLISGLPLVSID
ncbi:hypothetical protein MXD62_32695 [Frankia sp. Mgl5]|nr:hypothetical protein [Frankia sp. Mgl5]